MKTTAVLPLAVLRGWRWHFVRRFDQTFMPDSKACIRIEAATLHCRGSGTTLGLQSSWPQRLRRVNRASTQAQSGGSGWRLLTARVQ